MNFRKQKKIKSVWLDYFNFSTRERRGASFLSFILLLQIAVIIYLHNYETPVPAVDQQIIKDILALQIKKVYDKADERRDDHSFRPVLFDPNKIDSANAVAAGLSMKQTKVIQNYLAKGGVFRTKKDFSKMYCIPEKQFKLLEPFLLLPDSIVRDNMKPERKSNQVDIGKADSLTLMQARGIGPVFASRIIKYREKLGGFVSTDQLREVYGMKDTTFEKISKWIYLSDTVPFRFIHVNSDSLTIMAGHPYIRYKLAGIIFSYRNQHPFTSVNEIQSLPLITEENFRKLAPYLKID